MNYPADSSEATESAFYAAFAKCDIAAMQQLWVQAENTVCVHPGGPLLRGNTEILQSWSEILSNSSKPDIRYREIQRLASGDLAIHTVEELIRPAESEESPTRVIATNVYINTPEGWRILAHHASLPLVQLTKRKPSSLH
jgi:ketosteroid isomerase-like protein